jgi:hypothetical protein
MKRFEIPPLVIAKRWAQWPDDKKKDDKDYGISS